MLVVSGVRKPCTLPLGPPKALATSQSSTIRPASAPHQQPERRNQQRFPPVCHTHTHTNTHTRRREAQSPIVLSPTGGAVSRRLGATGVFGGHPGGGSLSDPAPKLWWEPPSQAAFACVLKLCNLFLTHDQREGKPARGKKNINLFSKFEQVFLKRGRRGFVYKGKRLRRGCQSARRAVSSHHNCLAGSSKAGRQDGALGGGSPKTPGPEDGTLEA